MYINDTVKKIQISVIRKIYEEMQNYENTINLSIGEPDLDVPDSVKKAVAYYAINGKIKYSPVGGMIELREKIANYYNKYFIENEFIEMNVAKPYNLNNVLVTVGSTEALSSTFTAILKEGDEVILPTPAYVGYSPLIEFSGAKPVFVDLSENNFNLDVTNLEKSITDKTRAIVLTYPNNPSGIILPFKEINKIVQLVNKHNIYLISDEIYGGIVFDKFYSFANYNKELEEKLIVISGFSKSHSMTGYRIGYLLANEHLVNEIKKVGQYRVTSTSTLSQYAAIAALDECADTSNISSVYKKRVEYFKNALENIGFQCLDAKGGFYVFANYTNIEKISKMNSIDLAFELLKKTGLAIVPGSIFHAEGYVRFSLIHDLPILEEAIKRLEIFLK